MDNQNQTISSTGDDEDFNSSSLLDPSQPPTEEDGKKRKFASSSEQAFDSKKVKTEVACEKSATTLLDPVEYKTWTKEQVYSLLVTNEEHGGAGLSCEKVKPLYDAGFDGTSLANIVNDIKKQKEESYIVDETSKSFPTVARDTIKTVVNWVDNLLKTINKIQNKIQADVIITAARTDPRFDYLRNLKDPNKLADLEKLIGKNIALPILGKSEHIPKDYDPNAPYLLTRQRFEMLKKVVYKRENDEGYVLSGPHGVSKSYTMYLLAAYAIVNSIPLLYVPKCGEWVKKYKTSKQTGAEEYLRDLCLYWNSDIFSYDQLEQLTITKDVVDFFTKTIAKTQDSLLLFDEHNELFKQDETGRLYSSLPYFYTFTKWTTGTSGSYSLTIYCGSAHSSFENHLPGGSEDKIIRIIPPTVDEFRTLVTDFELNHVPFDIICNATGRMPRELKFFALYLSKHSNIDNGVKIFMTERKRSFNERLIRFKEMQEKDIVKMLHQLFSYRSTVDVPDLFYDKGLLYRDEDSNFIPISDAARQALWKFYCDHFNSANIDTTLSSTTQGGLFEAAMKRTEGNVTQLVYCKFLCKVNSEGELETSVVDETISYSVNEIQKLSLTNISTLGFNNFIPKTCVIFSPDIDNFPCFDYLIVEYGYNNKLNLYFKQITMQTVDDHYFNTKTSKLKDFNLLFERKYIIKEGYHVSKENIESIDEQFQFSLFEVVLNSVTNMFKLEQQSDKRRKPLFKKGITYDDPLINAKGAKPECSCLNNDLIEGDFTIKWYYIYESAKSKTEQSTSKLRHSGILYRNRDNIIATSTIKFI